MKRMLIQTSAVGDGELTFIVAEAGVNHNGRYDYAKKLIQEAAFAGADAIKFQIFRTDEFCSEKSEYYRLFKGLELQDEEWHKLAQTARDAGIVFSASVFGEESADLLDAIGSPVFKIASGDLTHLPLLRYVAQKNKPVIISTGMSSIGEIEEAVETVRVRNQHIALLHCISNYPTDVKNANLAKITLLKEIFGVPVGYSDHSVGPLLSVAAVIKGANLLEKHFTLSKDLPGPDHQLSVDPQELSKMVREIRTIEQALCASSERPNESEEATKKVTRRSITAKRDIPQGSTITKDSIKIVRPGTGIAPKFVDLVIGRTAAKDIVAEEVISWDMI
jgi:N,N'-diacetyllegionaminate synthase